MKYAERLEAQRLRKEEGLGIRDISKKLGVSKASVSLWVRNIQLSSEQKYKLKMRCPIYNRKMSFGGNVGVYKKWLKIRISYQELGYAMAKQHALNPEFISGCMLYWAEGTKSINTLSFSNSDPEMIKYFVNFLRKYFHVKDEDLTLRIHRYSTSVPDTQQLKFWLNLTGLTSANLRKGQLNKHPTCSKKLKKTLLYGTCHVGVNRSQKILQTIYGVIQEFVGFRNSAWLRPVELWDKEIIGA
jgi:transcriptional regulator with XRE-family HTH domain